MRTLKELSDLTGKRALVTGGNGHVGRVAVQTLDELGAEVFSVDIEDFDLSDGKSSWEWVANYNKISILVHCAVYTGEGLDKSMSINVNSVLSLVGGTCNTLKTVVLFSSIYGLLGPDKSLYEGTDMTNPIAYGVSKGATLQLMRYLATTLAPHTRVNAISPGGIARNQPESFVERYEKKTPLKRMATEEDLKGAIAYLASDLSAYVTGHNLVVDGGWTAW
jgi:NAD(P)-dependent dehydrogenase (short-subunit alcohol dehydrogenase family)